MMKMCQRVIGALLMVRCNFFVGVRDPSSCDAVTCAHEVMGHGSWHLIFVSYIHNY